MAAKKMPAKKMPAKKVAAKKSSSGSSKSPGGGEAAQRKKSQAQAMLTGAKKQSKKGPYSLGRDVAGALGMIANKQAKSTVRGAMTAGRAVSKVVPGAGYLYNSTLGDMMKKAKKKK